jgi:hypothetical protein
MNALRQFVTVTDNASVQINLPPEYRQQRLEIIILPMDDMSEATLDAWGSVMDKMSATAQKNGLTPEILKDLLDE